MSKFRQDGKVALVTGGASGIGNAVSRVLAEQGGAVAVHYFNTADAEFTEWADDDTIDILMQVYGDSAVLAPNGTPRSFNFLTGVLPELAGRAR